MYYLLTMTKTEKRISMMDFEGNPNIGIYMFANNKFCLIGPEISEKKQKEIEKTLGVPVYNLTVLGTELIGIFVNGNDEYLFIPQMYDYELKEFDKIAKRHNIKIITLSDIQNTYGNNICIGDEEMLINPNYSKRFENEIKTQTNNKFKIIRIKNTNFNSIGSTCIFLNNHYFLSQEYQENEVKEILDKIAGLGTVNSGSNYMSSGVVGNKYGIILGSMCSTIEIQNIVENLDYL